MVATCHLFISFLKLTICLKKRCLNCVISQKSPSDKSTVVGKMVFCIFIMCSRCSTITVIANITKVRISFFSQSTQKIISITFNSCHSYQSLIWNILFDYFFFKTINGLTPMLLYKTNEENDWIFFWRINHHTTLLLWNASYAIEKSLA